MNMAKRNKLSMAEKRKRRQSSRATAREKTKQMYESLPPSKLDFKSKNKSTPSDESSSPSTENKVVDDPTPVANQAKELLESQRKSVNMLTMVRERVEEMLAKEKLSSALDENGYLVVDGFLGDAATIQEIEQEATNMLQDDELNADTSNLGSGEYIVPIQGGEQQYAKCPRLVELVISTTKHLPIEYDDSDTSLDASACMATLRVFDRKAYMASKALLTRSSEDDDGDAQVTPSYRTIVKDNEEDLRKLTLYYYVLDETWNGEFCGGGVAFESSGAVVPAQRDRLILFQSDTTSFRPIPWTGSENHQVGRCVELHLVKKKDQ